MILSTVTDEVLPDRSHGALPRIFRTAADQGVSTFEIRMVEAKRFPIVESEAWDRLLQYSREFGITYTSVSPGLFKTTLHSDLMRPHSNHLAAMSMDLAEAIGVKTIVTFGVLRDVRDGDDAFGRVVDLLRQTAEAAAARGFTVQLENLPHTWADTADNCMALLKAVDHPAFGYIWDVGNLYEAEPGDFRPGYEKLKPYIRNVHLKDGRIERGRMIWQQFGKGLTDIKGQIETLKADGYAGTLTVEAKCEPQMDEDFPNSLQYLRSLLGSTSKNKIATAGGTSRRMNFHAFQPQDTQMIVTAVTNEVYPDASVDSLPKIFKRAADVGIDHFELRIVESRRFPAYDAESWERLKKLGAEYGITYTAASPGLFKARLDSDLMALHAKYLLPMSLELAEAVDVNTMIVFGPTRFPETQPNEFDRVVDLIGNAVDTAVARGFTVQLENLPGSWADTSDACLKLLQAVDRKQFGYVWDTGNLYEAEQTHFQAGYDKLKPYIRNVHLKDGAIIDGEMVWKRYGEGVTDVKGQIETLRADGYKGTLVLEAACKPHHRDDFPTSVGYLGSSR